MKWHVRLTVPALKQLTEIKDTRIRESIGRRIEGLADEPDKQGKALSDELAGYRSLRAVGQRYRIIYRLEDEQVVVVVVAVGIRKARDKGDVYALATKLARIGLLDVE